MLASEEKTPPHPKKTPHKPAPNPTCNEQMWKV